MSDVLLLYLFTRLDALIGLGAVAAILSGVLTLLGGAVTAAHISDFTPSENEPRAWRMWRRFVGCGVAIFVIGLFLSIMVPSKQDMAIIVGGKIALDASRSDTAKEIGQEVLDAIRSQLKKAKEQ